MFRNLRVFVLSLDRETKICEDVRGTDGGVDCLPACCKNERIRGKNSFVRESSGAGSQEGNDGAR